ALTAGLLAVIAGTFHSKLWYHKMQEFYKYPDEYEVWFMGSSHVIMGTLPQELYKEYGIRSYNLADYGQTFALDYWIVKNLLKLSKPKLLVLDVAQIGFEEKYSRDNMSYARRIISSLPAGKDKTTAILDLFEGDLREEMLFPFSSDHYNWEYLTEKNFKTEECFELGSDQNIFDQRGKADYQLVTSATIPEPLALERALPPDSLLNYEYFRRLIELAQENEINVLLVKCPLAADERLLHWYNYAFLTGQEYGLPFLNGFELQDTFDGDTDLWDPFHMNSLGGRKWTHELGKYISEHYPELERTMTNASMRQRWEARYEDYVKWLDTELPLQSNFYSFLMLCTNPRYSLKIAIKKGSPVTKDALAKKLIRLCQSKITYVDNDENTPDIRIHVKNTDGETVDKAKFTARSENGTSYKRK
ncbi:MAG: hypothetical protein ACSW8H_10135, partial [bacterium]